MTAWRAFAVSTADHVAQVTLTGAREGNLLGADFWRELPQVFAEVETDPQVRAVVLTGAGAHFSYGLDLAAFGALLQPLLAERGLAGPRNELRQEIGRMQAAITSVAECRKPVIAAIHGWCIGGALDLVSAVDIRYASSAAQFSLREAKVGIVADLGSLQRLPAIVGEGHLREMAYTAEDLDAARAEKIGLVNRVFNTSEETLAAAHETAGRIAHNPPLVVQGVKHVLVQRTADEVAGGLRYLAAWNAAFLPSEDLVEAVGAVMEKREPEFRGE